MAKKKNDLTGAHITGGNVVFGDVHGDVTNYQSGGQVDFEISSELLVEFDRLLSELKARAQSAEQYASLANVAQAKEAMASGDKPNAIRLLKSAGRWILDVAKELSAEVAASVIAKIMGIK